jgi:flagellar basal-body rod protein FlgG
MKALYTAGTGMRVQQLQVDTIANNLANANTTGFKRSEVAFQDLLYQTIQQPGMETAAGQVSPTGLQVGSGARAVSTTKVFGQGTVEETGRDLDVAIQGDGFLQVRLPDGSSAYTRDGSLRIDANGALVTAEGLRLEPQITLPADASSITIGKDGTITATSAGATETATTLGQLTLVRFPNPSGLSSEGGNLYRATPSSGAATVATPGESGAGSLAQRFLERSNVEVVSELVSLIVAQRAYEVNSRAIKAGDEMMGQVSNLGR